MKDKYEQVVDNVPFTEPLDTPWKLACCDCGLVHAVTISIDHEGENAVLLINRDRKETSKRRRSAVGQKLPFGKRQPHELRDEARALLPKIDAANWIEDLPHTEMEELIRKLAK